MSDNGWVCSYRKIWEHPIFKGNALRVGIFKWLLHKAAWKETTFRVGEVKITVQRGQLCVTQAEICEGTGASRQQIRTLLDLLKSTKAITIVSANGTTKGRSLLTIVNYDKYQIDGGEATKDPAEGSTKEQPIKEQENKDNNTPPSEEAAAPPVRLTDLKRMCWAYGKEYLGRHDVPNPGSLIGKWLKAATATQVLAAIEAAEEAATEDPVPYITKTLTGRGSTVDVRAMMAEIAGGQQ